MENNDVPLMQKMKRFINKVDEAINEISNSIENKYIDNLNNYLSGLTCLEKRLMVEYMYNKLLGQLFENIKNTFSTIISENKNTINSIDRELDSIRDKKIKYEEKDKYSELSRRISEDLIKILKSSSNLGELSEKIQVFSLSLDNKSRSFEEKSRNIEEKLGRLRENLKRIKEELTRGGYK